MEARECCGSGCEDCVLLVGEERLRREEAARVLAESSEEEDVLSGGEGR